MWKEGDKVTVTGYIKHKATVKKCTQEYHNVLANCQRAKFKEAKENLPEDCYLSNIMDTSRA